MMEKPEIFYLPYQKRVVIRPAHPFDAWGFVASLNSVCMEGIYLLHDKSPRTVQEQEELIRRIDPSKNLIAVVELDNYIVGGIVVLVGGSSLKAQTFCTLGLHLVKGARNYGIGSKMMEYAIRWARKRGFHKICLSVFATNERAIHLYKKYGFVEEGLRKEQYMAGGKYIDEVLMSKFLDTMQ